VGGNTREGGKRFYVREEFADEGKQHADSILAGTGMELPAGCEPMVWYQSVAKDKKTGR
jgi:hypothetical protein